MQRDLLYTGHWALILEAEPYYATPQGIPTTRAGSVVTSEDRVQRDLLYTGHPVMERCSVVSRIAPSFLRFGSFEICKPSDPSTGARPRSSMWLFGVLCLIHVCVRHLGSEGAVLAVLVIRCVHPLSQLFALCKNPYQQPLTY